MDVVFQPRCAPSEGEPKQLAQCLKMTVLHNPFDATVFRLAGTCVSHDVVFEDLPGESVADELVFEQVRGTPTSSVIWYRCGRTQEVRRAIFLFCVFAILNNVQQHWMTFNVAHSETFSDRK